MQLNSGLHTLGYNDVGDVWISEFTPAGVIKKTALPCIKSSFTCGARLTPFIYCRNLYFVHMTTGDDDHMFRVFAIDDPTCSRLEFDVILYRDGTIDLRRGYGIYDEIASRVASRRMHTQIVGDILYVALVGSIIGVNMDTKTIAHVITSDCHIMPIFLATPSIVFMGNMSNFTSDTIRVSCIHKNLPLGYVDNSRVPLHWLRSDSSMCFADGCIDLRKACVTWNGDEPAVDIDHAEIAVEYKEAFWEQSVFVTDDIIALAVIKPDICELRIIDMRNGDMYGVPCDYGELGARDYVSHMIITADAYHSFCT